MTKKLDKSRPYGEVRGDGEVDGFVGVRYVQDGTYFSGDGNVARFDGDTNDDTIAPVAPVAPVAPKPRKKKPESGSVTNAVAVTDGAADATNSEATAGA